MNQGTQAGNTIKSIHTAFRILESLRVHDGMGVTGLANELDLAKSTAHRYLDTLLECGCLTKEGDQYRVGLKLLDYGTFARGKIQGIKLIDRTVEAIATETGERAQFVVEEHGEAVQVSYELGANAVDINVGLGNRMPLHVISPGKAIMARWADGDIEAHIEEHGLKRMTDETIVDRDELFVGIERIRERGYAINDREHVDGVRSVGIAVDDGHGQLIGGLSVSGPVHRMKRDWLENELVDLLRGTANELELNLRYADDGPYHY